MATANDAPGARIYALWNRLSPLPGGKRIFSWMMGRMAPYSGNIGATVLELSPCHSRVMMREKRKLQQHLRSVHAVALVNLAELATGLAMLVGLPRGTRGIVVSISMDYHRKARGVLVAECDCELPEVTESVDFEVPGRIVDEAGEVVATATVTWRLAPPRESQAARDDAVAAHATA